MLDFHGDITTTTLVIDGVALNQPYNWGPCPCGMLERNRTWVQGGSKWPQIIYNYSQSDHFIIETHGFNDPQFKTPSSVHEVETKTIWNIRSALSNTRISAKVGLELWPQMWWAVLEPLTSSVFFARCNAKIVSSWINRVKNYQISLIFINIH